MKYLGIFTILVVLFLAGCVDQKENPTDPDQIVDLNQSYSSGDDRLAFPPHAISTDPEVDAAEANIIQGDPEATYDPPGERIKVFTDFESFDEATGELTIIDFEDLPAWGSSCPGPQGYEDSIPNPMTINGVTFDDPWCLESAFCPAHACPGGGVLLIIHTFATIDYPPETGSVMLTVEGHGDDPFLLRVEDWSGAEISVLHHGIPYGTRYIGFTSSVGIAQVQFLGAITHGNLPLREVYLEGRGSP